MSHSSRATRPPGSSEGRTRKVSRSGLSTMSDSSIRTKPSIAEPSKRMSPERPLSNWLSGTSKFLLTPRMSVNCSRRNATPCSRQRLRISFFVAPVVFSAVAVIQWGGRRRYGAAGGGNAYRPLPPLAAPYRLRSHVVVQEELVGMWPQPYRIVLSRPLVAEPGLDHVRREHPALEQERMIGLERRQRVRERARRVLHMPALLRLELVEIHVHRLGRLDLVLDAVEPGHQQRREREIRVARGVRGPVLDALRLGRLGIHGNAADRRAVALRVDQVDRRLVPRHQPPIAVRRRRREGEQGRCMLD